MSFCEHGSVTSAPAEALGGAEFATRLVAVRAARKVEMQPGAHPRFTITTALGMYLQAIEVVHRERTTAFCYCAVGSSLGIAEATDEYHVPVFVMATPTDADALADQLNHERLGLSRQQAETIIGQSWARFPGASASSKIIDCARNSEGTHLARPALGQLVTAVLLK